MKTPDETNSYVYEEWLEWEGHWELIDGTPYNMTPAPSWDHQYIVGELYFGLRSHFQNESCFVAVAPFDVYLSENEDYEKPEHVVQPDITVMCNEKLLSKKGYYGAPNLIVEVLSPSTALKDRNEKFKKYQQFGVKEYWIVDPNYKMIEVFGLEDGYYRKKEVFGEDNKLKSFIFEDLEITLKQIFEK